MKIAFVFPRARYPSGQPPLGILSLAAYLRQTVPSTQIDVIDLNRVAIYSVDMDWVEDDFEMRGFYRTGHFHWGYEGDLFGLYPEANYGPNIDIYNGEAPFGAEVTFKKELTGLKAAFCHSQLGGAAPVVAGMIQEKLGFKYHWAVADYLQRAARHIASKTDVDQAFPVAGMVGMEAPKASPAGLAWPKGWSPRRISSASIGIFSIRSTGPSLVIRMWSRWLGKLGNDQPLPGPLATAMSANRYSSGASMKF